MKSKKNDYFQMMTELIAYSVEAADKLCAFLAHEEHRDLEVARDEIHAVEHAADGAKHEVTSKLAREFITPIERDDILSLVNIIDDITDALDDVTIKLYMYGVERTDADLSRFASTVSDCVHATAEMIAELGDFRKSKSLPGLVIKVNDLETVADELHIEATHKLFTSGGDPLRVMAIKAVYDSLEDCCDLCEHAADVVETTVMNNI